MTTRQLGAPAEHPPHPGSWREVVGTSLQVAFKICNHKKPAQITPGSCWFEISGFFLQKRSECMAKRSAMEAILTKSISSSLINSQKLISILKWTSKANVQPKKKQFPWNGCNFANVFPGDGTSVRRPKGAPWGRTSPIFCVAFFLQLFEVYLYASTKSRFNTIVLTV